MVDGVHVKVSGNRFHHTWGGNVGDESLHDLVDADHLEAEARRALAGALGEIADIDPGDAPLRLRDYLQQLGFRMVIVPKGADVKVTE